MATYIKDLKEDNGDIVYPHTNTDAVYTSGGETLETRISKYVTAEDIASSVASFGTVTSGMIDDDAITTAKIDDSAVTTAKIDDDAVTTAKLDDGAVTTAKLATGAVTSSNIDWSTIQGEKFIGHYTSGNSFPLPLGYSIYHIRGQISYGTSSANGLIYLTVNNRTGTDWLRRLHLSASGVDYAEFSYTDGHMLNFGSGPALTTSAGMVTIDMTVKKKTGSENVLVTICNFTHRGAQACGMSFGENSIADVTVGHTVTFASGSPRTFSEMDIVVTGVEAS